MSIVQAIVISKEYFTKRQAENWIKRHPEFKPIKKIHETIHTYRFRLKFPDDRFDYRMKTLTTGVKAVIGFLPYQLYE